MAPFSEELKEPPCHVAIVMDGNGRWAKARGLPRAEDIGVVRKRRVGLSNPRPISACVT